MYNSLVVFDYRKYDIEHKNIFYNMIILNLYNLYVMIENVRKLIEFIQWR